MTSFTEYGGKRFTPLYAQYVYTQHTHVKPIQQKCTSTPKKISSLRESIDNLQERCLELEGEMRPNRIRHNRGIRSEIDKIKKEINNKVN